MQAWGFFPTSGVRHHQFYEFPVAAPLKNKAILELARSLH
jgi:hypothetical protein